MNTTQTKMLKWIQGKTRKYHIRNIIIREKANIKQINTFLKTKILSWFGHVQGRDDDDVAKSVLNTRIDGYRPRGRPKLRCMDRLKDDVKKNNIHPEWASDRESWFEMIQNVIDSTLPRKRGKVRGKKVRKNKASTHSSYVRQCECPP